MLPFFTDEETEALRGHVISLDHTTSKKKVLEPELGSIGCQNVCSRSLLSTRGEENQTAILCVMDVGESDHA